MWRQAPCKVGTGPVRKKSPPTPMDRWPHKTRAAGRKPSSVPGCPGDDHSSRTPVARGLQRPTRELRTGRPQTLPYLVLLQVGFSKPAMSPLPLVSSYLTLSPLPWTYHGGLVSEALSLGLPPLGITQHLALWSSDFPPATERRRRSSGLLRGPLGWKIRGISNSHPLMIFYLAGASWSMARFAAWSARWFSSRGTWAMAQDSKFFRALRASRHKGMRWGLFTR